MAKIPMATITKSMTRWSEYSSAYLPEEKIVYWGSATGTTNNNGEFLIDIEPFQFISGISMTGDVQATFRKNTDGTKIVAHCTTYQNTAAQNVDVTIAINYFSSI